MLENTPGMVVVGEAADGPAAIDGVRRTQPHVLISDLDMPGLDGFEVIRQVLRDSPKTQILVISGEPAVTAEPEALRLGAARYLEKGTSVADVVAVVRDLVAADVASALRRRPEVWAFVALFVALAVFFAHCAFGLGDGASSDVYDVWLQNAIALGAAVICLFGARRFGSWHSGWVCTATGMLLFAAGTLVWAVRFIHDTDPPYPSASDWLWLAFYPLAYAGLVLTLRRRDTPADRSMWIDGLLGASALGALSATAILPRLINDADDGGAAAIVNILYSLADLGLALVLVVFFSARGWRMARGPALLGVAMVMLATADTVYLWRINSDSYVPGTWLDSLWMIALVLMAVAAWMPADRDEYRPGVTRAGVVIPALAFMTALGVLVYGNLAHVSLGGLVLATITMLLALARLGSSYAQSVSLAQSRRDALTDELTGLCNRRAVMRDLELATAEGAWVFALYDLDGFKAYNDTFGHPEGDLLLRRLGERVAEAVAGQGTAYRLGGDEFCVLLDNQQGQADATLQSCHDALCDSGEGFGVGASYGLVAIPDDAGAPAEALRLADQRMYAMKASNPQAVEVQSSNVVMQALAERHPEHRVKPSFVVRAVAVGRALGMQGRSLTDLARAAELHDVGKLAIPDGILEKADALTDDEYGFVLRHPETGERILSAAPALEPVARIVRATHERFDGTGHPDLLTGYKIPLASRIINVCDAYDAMTNERPYRDPVTHPLALEELQRCAGTQFDPDVVRAFLQQFQPSKDASPTAHLHDT